MRDSPRLISATLNLSVHDVSGNLDVHDVPGFDSGESGLELSAAALMRAG